MESSDLLQLTERGLYCAAGDFYLDPWQGVDRAVITHAHADHARWGSHNYLTARTGEHVLRLRLDPAATIQTVEYGEPVTIGGVRVSLHPAGHILGSAQVRLEAHGEVWVVSGDYKLEADPTCTPFEPIRCHTFVTESTFGLPIYRWQKSAAVFDEVNAWWRANREAGKASILFGYALGKSQRLLAGLDPAIGPIYTHGAVERLNAAYRVTGISLPDTTYAAEAPKGTDWSGAVILAPPSAQATPWTRKFGSSATAVASGWMQIRGVRRRKAIDRGFVLSDHADWPGLLDAIRSTGATRVWVTHGYTAILVRYLRELGLDAQVVQTLFEGERAEVTGEGTETGEDSPNAEGAP